MTEQRHLYIISGPNGAGKTTASYVRRYYEGIRNFFSIYAPIVEYWTLVDNSEVPRTIVAKGGQDIQTDIINIDKYNTIKEYVRKRL